MAQKILNLRCNHCIEPIGVDDLPHFSYQIEASDPTISQTALRITVADASCTGWDSGFMESDAQILLPYAGEALSPCTRYAWQVTVRTSDANETTSPIAYFESGSMQSFGWKAKWITNSSSAIFIGNHCGRRKEYPAP